MRPAYCKARMPGARRMGHEPARACTSRHALHVLAAVLRPQHLHSADYDNRHAAIHVPWKFLRMLPFLLPQRARTQAHERGHLHAPGNISLALLCLVVGAARQWRPAAALLGAGFRVPLGHCALLQGRWALDVGVMHEHLGKGSWRNTSNKEYCACCSGGAICGPDTRAG